MIGNKLIIHFAALPSTQTESPSFCQAFILADRTYKIPMHTRLDEILIPAQEVAILKTVLGRLGDEQNLTTSFDGGTKNDEAYFTIHISNMKRHVYLLEVRYMMDDTHTAQWIRGLVKAWIEKISSERFCAACSDNTGNTLLAQQLLHQDFPHILSVANICHHLNNTSKDIVKLKFFDVPIKIIHSSLKTFSKSHPAKSALKVARHQKQTGPGLEATGKTRFVTLTLSAILVHRTLLALQQVFSTPQKFDFEYKEYFQPANHKLKAHKFKDDLE
ncbi:hypothetical protein D9758_011665 [Tetrapyrgos nigripes]|uniref:DUF659 domain-containing protein n=1 Tax=Tetrapyrgos nigripes TaxID=182062 RepID=A0A8H5FS42_9AGAR|nr:hypothetical protein D9758_011665 [Tetrapyrgos nigripes]